MLHIGDKTLNESSVFPTRLVCRGSLREAIVITLADVTYEEIKETFVDDIAITKSYSDRFRQNVNEDYSSYCVAGEIVDKRDGTFTVSMCKRTEQELHDIEVAALEAENARLLFEMLTGEEY